MALIYPFRGYRYDPGVVGSVDAVVTQPYDKISEELQEDYYGRSEFNVARVTRSKEKRKDPATGYPEAGLALRQWISGEAIRRETAPAIYAYNREYEVDGEKKTQNGFIALLDVRYSGGGIFPHEHTMAEPKMDRLRLMRATECNEDLIFTLYTDDKMTVDRLLGGKTTSRAPDVVATDDFKAVHRVWAITDAKILKKIQDAMVPEELFIADGHHRFETSVNFMKECKAKGWKPTAPESFDKRLVACFNSAGQETTILATHRLVRDLSTFDSAAVLKAAEPYFDIEPVSSPEGLWDSMRKGRDGHVFGFYPGDARRCYLLRLNEEGKVDPLMLSHGEAYRHLDVSILHTLILDRILGIDAKRLAAQSNVDYARDRVACLRRVDEGKYQAAFFLNPTTVEQVQRVALLGERMPQKSTDFYPKLLTGLVFMVMEISKTGA